MLRVFSLLLVFCALALGGCGAGEDGGSSGSEPSASKEDRTTKPRADKVKACLIRGKVPEPERRGKNFWRGLLEGGGGIRVERFPSKARAAAVVRQAVDIDAAATGRYAVLGPFKEVGAAENVEAVADCLKNG
jgi:hypothetical protein